MKKRGILLLVVSIGLTLTACTSFPKTADRTTGSIADDTAQDKFQEMEKLPASQEYISSNGVYKVILLEGLTQTDMPLQAGTSMMGLEGETKIPGFTGVALGGPKAKILGNPDDIENLEDYADYISDISLKGSNVTIDWQDADASSPEGAERCLAREGVARSGPWQGKAYGYYVESADSYFSVVIMGNSGDIDEARQILALEILDGTPLQGGTKDFINGMTAILDFVNAGNIREYYKMLVDMDGDGSQLLQVSYQIQKKLSDNWGVENTADLMETADWLMNEGHNQDAIELLGEYGGTNETDRASFDAKLQEQNLDDGTYIRLLAAYDAWLAYGDGALAAWDLSRLGTVMSMGYVSGYCTYEEAMDKMLEAAQKSQELFDSWEDFNKSYLYGYSYWAQESLDDLESSSAERAELVTNLESQANGPFSVDWNMELKKEW